MNQVEKDNKLIGARIKACGSIEELTILREEQYRLNRDMGDSFEFTKDLYREPTHFVYELLQNADNHGAKTAHFRLEKNSVIFDHDGTDEFDMDSVKAITGISNSTKKGIANFGLGFKSVFAISDRPEVYSRKFNFAIEKISIPYQIPPVDLGRYTTKFILPFSAKKYTIAEIHSMVRKCLDSINLSAIMFLRNLQTIKIDIDDKQRDISFVKEPNGPCCTVCTDNANDAKFLVFRDDSGCSIAYEIDDDGDIVSPEGYPYVSVFLPTRTQSEVNFVVDAQFHTPPDREKINYDDRDPKRGLDNRTTLNNLKQLFKKSILSLKKMGYLTPQNIQMLPIEQSENDNPLNHALHDGLVEVMKSHACIPTTDKKFSTPDKVHFSVYDDVQRLVTDKKWAEFSYANEESLQNFYRDALGVRQYEFPNLLSDLRPKELKQKDEKWLYRFYECLYMWLDDIWRRRYIIDSVRERPIIKTRTGNFSPVEKNGEKMVFRASTGISKAKTIHSLFTTESKNVSDDTKRTMRKLLDELDIHERRPSDTISQEILSQWDGSTNQQKIKLFHEMARIYNEADQDEKSQIISYLSDKDILLTKIKHKLVWTNKPLYADCEDLHLLLDGIDGASFIDSRLWSEEYEEHTSKNGTSQIICKGTNEFCQALGVSLKLRVERYFADEYRFDSEYSPSMDFLREYPQTKAIDLSACRFWTSRTYYIENFGDILKKIDSPKKVQMLIMQLSSMSGEYASGQLAVNGENSWSLRTARVYTIPSDPFIKLNQYEWLPDDKGNKISLKNITRQDFIKNYGFEDDEPILMKLVFKNDTLSELPEADQKILETTRGLTPYEVSLAIGEYKERQRLEFPSEEGIIYFGDSYDSVETPVLMTDPPKKSRKVISDSDKGSKVSNTTTLKYGQNKSKKITNLAKVAGDYNERTAMFYLADTYQVEDYNVWDDETWREFSTPDGITVRHLGGNHEGYDIEIRQGDAIIRRIEVKKYEIGEVSISETEWEMAKKFPDTYDIYRIKHVENGPDSVLVERAPFRQYENGEVEFVPAKLRFVRELE